MQIDKEKLQKLLSLSDEEIKKKVSDAVSSINLDKKDRETLDKALKNMKDIKKTIGSIDGESIKKAVDTLGAEKIEELKKTIRN